MGNRELSVFDVENALMFVSCDTTDIDDPEEVFERNFPFTFRNGKLICFEVAPDEVDTDFDMEEYDEVFRGNYNLEKYSTLQAFANAVLNREGKEYVKALYYDEELVIDNRFTFTLFNAEREAVFTYSKVVNVELPKSIIEEKEKESLSPEDISKSLKKNLEIREDKYQHDRRVVLLHILLLLIVTALVYWMGSSAGWSPFGKWLISITSGLYFTQWLWSNIPNEHLGVFENSTRRAKGRFWINGGFILGIILTIVNVVYDINNPPFDSFAHYYMMWWLFTLLITLTLYILAMDYRYRKYPASPIEMNLRKWKRKQFVRDFFLDMLPIDWEIKIRNKHLERLDRKEKEEGL